MNSLYPSLLVLMTLFLLNSCCKDYGDILPEVELEGNPGNPRFNLQFDNEQNVDLDLYVRTPLGDVIFYGSPFSATSMGQLDVDCLCGSCPNGPNENIFFPLDGSSPKGTYEYWVDYYSACNAGGAESNYTLRLLRVNTVLRTHRGSLTSGESEIFTYEHE